MLEGQRCLDLTREQSDQDARDARVCPMCKEVQGQ